MSSIAIAVVAAVAVLVAGPAFGQAPMPAPGPEQALFKMDEGVWDATIELTPPGIPAMTSTAVETNTVGCGGLCLITDIKGELMQGMAFHGHGLTTWDSVAKKYVGSWTDSMSIGLATAEGTYDAAAKKMTTTMESREAGGALVKSRAVSEYPSPDRRVMTMFTAGPDGKEVQMMRITYTKRK